ncbi:DUF3616 domain-containing protein [Thiorhodovibrio frisius]|nr:DUF3616 domain-containing protein [Thiorhodovibrio frisius]
MTTLLFIITLLFTGTSDASWRPFTSSDVTDELYEPSAVRQLPNGQFLVVQDESKDPFVLFEYIDGKLKNFIRPPLKTEKQPFWVIGADTRPKNLEDLEGLAQSPDGYLFAITSHSRTESAAKKKDSRQKLVRMRIADNEIVEYALFEELLKAITDAYPELKKPTKDDNPKGRHGFGIEGLCFDATGKHLWIGLRAPVIKGDSLILILENPHQLFSEKSTPRFSPKPLRLKMGKGGIRAMTYVPELNGYLLVTQKAKKKSKSEKSFKLWFMENREGAEPEKITLNGIDLEKTEGITHFRDNNQTVIMLVSDDGNSASEHPAQYLTVPLDELHIPSRADN